MPEERFTKRTNYPNALSSYCIPCEATYRHELYSKNPEKWNANRRKWARKNAEKLRGYAIKRKYGISLAEYDCILVSQDGACKICRRIPADKPLQVDHDHATGKIRGLLCFRCNAALGLLGEDSETTKNLLEYIQGDLP